MANTYLVTYDQVGSDSVRDEKRGEHIAFRKGLGDALLLSGPLLDEQDGAIGSMVIVEGESSDGVRAIVERDPFVIHGVLAVQNITRMRIAKASIPERG